MLEITLTIPTSCDFLIVTALEEERAAVQSKLPFRIAPPSAEYVLDSYVAHVSAGADQPESYVCVLVCANRQGRTTASSVANAAIDRWKPRQVLLVGIAGGFREHVSLGDVIISDRIIDYALGKKTVDGLNRRLREYVVDRRIEEMARLVSRGEWRTFIEVPRLDNTTKTKAVFGPVASGDTVIAATGALADVRATYPSILGVEMEAGGVAVAVHDSAEPKPGFIMIRGVSDLADDAKNHKATESWRPYACDVAAAFAVAMIRSFRLPPRTMNSSGTQSTSLASRLEAMHAGQLAKVGALNFAARRAPGGLKAIGDLAREALGCVLPTFPHAIDVGSYIASQSLPLQLVTQSVLTIDLTVDQLRAPMPFGVSWRSLLILAETGHLFFNLRDYDSQKRHDFPGYCGDPKVAERLDEVITKLPTKIYVGSAVRKAVFDAALADVKPGVTYESFHNTAMVELKDAFDALDAFHEEHATVKASNFRGERPPRDAVCWQWAFLNSVAHHLSAYNLVGTSDCDLNRLYVAAVEAGGRAKGTNNEEIRLEAASALVAFARNVRTSHLTFTAPITASYGTTYNMSEQEYKDAVRLGRYWEQGQAFAMRSDEASRFVAHVLDDTRRDNTHDVGTQRALSDNVAVAVAEGQIFSDSHVDRLINVLARNGPRLIEAADIMSNLQADYRSGNTVPRERLTRWITQYRDIKAENVESLRKGSGDGPDGMFKVMGDGRGSETTSPWIESLGLEGLPSDQERQLMPPLEARAIFRVRRVFEREAR